MGRPGATGGQPRDLAAGLAGAAKSLTSPQKPATRGSEAIDAGSAGRPGRRRGRASFSRRRSPAARCRAPGRRRADPVGRQRPRARHACRHGDAGDRRRLAIVGDARLRPGLRRCRHRVARHHRGRRHPLGHGLGERRHRPPGRGRAEGDEPRGDPGRPKRRHLRALCRAAARRRPQSRRAPPGDHREPVRPDAGPAGRGPPPRRRRRDGQRDGRRALAPASIRSRRRRCGCRRCWRRPAASRSCPTSRR